MCEGEDTAEDKASRDTSFIVPLASGVTEDRRPRPEFNEGHGENPSEELCDRQHRCPHHIHSDYENEKC